MATASQRIGILGGTFDPVHLGHLITAEQAREQGRLDEVWFIPAARPPHKDAQSVSSFERRVEMLALALAGNPQFRIDEIEKDRPGPSYTVDTLTELKAGNPDIEFQLIIGSDCLPDLPGWRDPAGILNKVGVLCVSRPGWPDWDAARLAQETGLPEEQVSLVNVDNPLCDISSQEIRRRVAEGRSVRYLVPHAVLCYIDTHKLYRA